MHRQAGRIRMRTRRFSFRRDRACPCPSCPLWAPGPHMGEGRELYMSKDKKVSKISQTTEDDEFDSDGYDELELLERLESLREDMEDLGISTLDELIKRI